MWRIAVFVVVLAETCAWAQPGPSQPLTLVRARALAERIARDDAQIQSGDAPKRIHAARDRAEVFDEMFGVLQSPVAGGARSIEDGAESELRTRTGVSFDDFRRGSTPAWRRCADLVRKLHATDDEARTCVARASADTWGSSVALQAFALASVELASGDYDGVIAHLGSRRGSYDADVTVAVALIGQGRLDDASALLDQCIRREPARPEAYFNRALLAATRRYESEKKAWITTQDRLAFEHFKAFLRLREHATLTAPGDTWLAAGQGAEEAERRLTGKSHWSWRTGDERARPFLPQNLLPPSMRD
jgi:hypothetical protein